MDGSGHRAPNRASRNEAYRNELRYAHRVDLKMHDNQCQAQRTKDQVGGMQARQSHESGATVARAHRQAAQERLQLPPRIRRSTPPCAQLIGIRPKSQHAERHVW